MPFFLPSRRRAAPFARDVGGWRAVAFPLLSLVLLMGGVPRDAMAQSGGAPTAGATPPAQAAQAADPWQWLEEVSGDRALAWVRERNAATQKVLKADPRFEPIRQGLLEVLDSRDRIPAIHRIGDRFYNFWRDPQNPRGLWRRTTLDGFRQASPPWEVVVDLDALAKAEGENWVWGGAECLPGGRRCLVSLSRGGADAAVVREFDLDSKAFVPGGFALPEGKHRLEWLDMDTLLVGTDRGAGSLTDSGYPRTLLRWKRGTPLAQAVQIFEGKPQDVTVAAQVDPTAGYRRVLLARQLDFYNVERWLLQPDGAQLRIDLPTDTDLTFWRDLALLNPRSDLTLGGERHPAGSLVAVDAQALIEGRPLRPQRLFTPTETRSLDAYLPTRGRLLLTVLDNVSSRLEEWQRVDPTGTGQAIRWEQRTVTTPFPGTLWVRPLHDVTARGNDPWAEDYLIGYQDFLTPSRLMLARSGGDARETLKTQPPFFDATGMRVEQAFARSRDGTRVPYFIMWPKGAQADGRNPTLLYGYGGFEVSLQPAYSGGWGRSWLGRGGVMVMANIRGGGEYGPQWHQAALKANRQRAYDDFAAVAEDLIARRVTAPRHLGIMGGSNGGLLTGTVMLQRPELFNAVVSQVPLLDMRRFHTLLAGASWMGEYGNPDDPADWAYISRYSPYQNVRADMKLPPVLFITSTRDDRVHPGHARKMAARMLEQGHSVLYYENIEGGHGGAANNAQRAEMSALEYTFLWRQLGGGEGAPAR